MDLQVTTYALRLMKEGNLGEYQVNECFEDPSDEFSMGPFTIMKRMIGDKCAILMYTNEQSGIPKLEAVYRVYQDFIKSTLVSVAPVQMLREFMDKFGIETETKFGKTKCLINIEEKIFFGGKLNHELYLDALSKKM